MCVYIYIYIYICVCVLVSKLYGSLARELEGFVARLSKQIPYLGYASTENNKVVWGA